MSRSQFDSDLRQFLLMNRLAISTLNFLNQLLATKDTIGLFGHMDTIVHSTNTASDFLDKYGDFFTALDEKLGLNTMQSVKRTRASLVSVRKGIGQLGSFVSENRYELVENQLKDLSQLASALREDVSMFAILPAKIDYSRLDAQTWKMIGKAGVHYRSKVFLSYPWRNKNPNKDKNELMINSYVKPVLELLDIEPVTLRDYSLPQDPIDEKAIRLIGDCDGVIAFYTKRDTVRNVEHEMAQNSNVIAICNEGGTSGPSMRRGRLQIDFDRADMSTLIIDLIKALKEKALFNLLV